MDSLKGTVEKGVFCVHLMDGVAHGQTQRDDGLKSSRATRWSISEIIVTFFLFVALSAKLRLEFGHSSQLV